MEFNLADLFEHSADQFPERECLVAEGARRTYAQMDARANQLAHFLLAQGVRPGEHVGIYAYNSVEWVEALWAIFKIRAVWININYRYVEDELRYLFGNADLVGLIYQREFAPRIRGVRDALPGLRFSLAIEDASDADTTGLDSYDYEQALASGSPVRDFDKRSADDRYILYTGGTTGMPKGVVWRHEDVLMTLGGGIDVLTGQRAQTPRGHGRARPRRRARPCSRSRRSCTAPPSGASWAAASSAARPCWSRSSTRRTSGGWSSASG